MVIAPYMSLDEVFQRIEERGVKRFAEKVVKGKKTVFDRLARM